MEREKQVKGFCFIQEVLNMFIGFGVNTQSMLKIMLENSFGNDKE